MAQGNRCHAPRTAVTLSHPSASPGEPPCPQAPTLPSDRSRSGPVLQGRPVSNREAGCVLSGPQRPGDQGTRFTGTRERRQQEPRASNRRRDGCSCHRLRLRRGDLAPKRSTLRVVQTPVRTTARVTPVVMRRPRENAAPRICAMPKRKRTSAHFRLSGHALSTLAVRPGPQALVEHCTWG